MGVLRNGITVYDNIDTNKNGRRRKKEEEM